MAFDGIVVASLASELKHKLLNGRSVSSVDFGGCFSSAGLSDLEE